MRRLVVGVKLVVQFVGLDRAFRAVGVRRGQRRAHILQPDAVFEQRRRVELDPHRRQRGAADDHLADAVDLRQFLRQHVGRRIVHLPARQGLRRQRQDQHRRIGRVDLPVGRVAAQAGRQIGSRGVDRCLHVARGAVDVAIRARTAARSAPTRPNWWRSSRSRRRSARDAVPAGWRRWWRRSPDWRPATVPAPRWSENPPAAAARPAA